MPVTGVRSGVVTPKDKTKSKRLANQNVRILSIALVKYRFSFSALVKFNQYLTQYRYQYIIAFYYLHVFFIHFYNASVYNKSYSERQFFCFKSSNVESLESL